jgi:hypothetical protein
MTLFCTALFADDDDSNSDERAKTLIEYRVVGYTAATNGAIQRVDPLLTGVAAMHSLCAEVDPNARAAFSDEAIRTPFVEGAPKFAWVVPARTEVMRVADATTINNDWIAVDGVSGVETTKFGFANPQSAIGRALCEGYQSNSRIRSGLVIGTESGRILKGDCDESMPIACSAPVVVPISP